MLVARLDKLGKRPARTLRRMPSEQRFALTVFTGFALALALLGILFAFSADGGSGRFGRGGRQSTGFLAQEQPQSQSQTHPEALRPASLAPPAR